VGIALLIGQSPNVNQQNNLVYEQLSHKIWAAISFPARYDEYEAQHTLSRNV
jgi:hypothetical protein